MTVHAPPVISGSPDTIAGGLLAARIGDAVACGSHGPVSAYGAKPEDNYVDVVSRNDNCLLTEAEGDLENPPLPDE